MTELCHVKIIECSHIYTGYLETVNANIHNIAIELENEEAKKNTKPWVQPKEKESNILEC